MKKALLLSAVLLVAMCSFADPIVNNFTGYNDGWYSFGDPPHATQTYGEIFTAPPGAYNNLLGFSFYTGDPYFSGDIITGAYIATWTGTHAGELLYSSPQINYDNLGNEEVNFSTGGRLQVTHGAQYVMFLSTTNYHGQSVGATFVSHGAPNQYLDGFAFYNNGGDFNALFTSDWDAYGLQPDWAVDLEFGDALPEPGSLILLGTGIVGGLGVLRRRLL